MLFVYINTPLPPPPPPPFLIHPHSLFNSYIPSYSNMSLSKPARYDYPNHKDRSSYQKEAFIRFFGRPTPSHLVCTNCTNDPEECFMFLYSKLATQCSACMGKSKGNSSFIIMLTQLALLIPIFKIGSLI